MAEGSKIEWCDHTFNPWIGCTKVSKGCDNCYAETMAGRYKWAVWGKDQPRKRTSVANWKKPIQWNKQAEKLGIRYRVFCASLADWLDPEVPNQWRLDLLLLIQKTPHLDWLMLTKRIELLPKLVRDCCWLDEDEDLYIHPNMWLGVSAENQAMWDKRLPHLLSYKNHITFVSVEPLLGRITMGSHRPDWIIVGGESGPGAREMSPLWASELCAQCSLIEPKVAFFFKQHGGVNKKKTGRILHGRTYDEFPVMKRDNLEGQ